VSLPSEIDPATLNHDPESVQRYRTDPLVHHVDNARWFTEVLATLEEVHRGAGSIRVPLVVHQAGEDALVCPDAAARFAGAVPGATYHLVADGWHELLFEPDGRALFGRILDDLESHCHAPHG
jgi:alpha-beta hydrolase superfamily lysophospholipase